MKKNYIPLIVCLFVYFSCGNNRKNATVDFGDDKSVTKIGIEEIAIYDECKIYNNNLSSIASKVKFVNLSVKPLINDFRVRDVAISADFIFLQGMKFIYQYDKSGKFIRNIGGFGNGPSEYVNADAPLLIDETGHLIYVSDISRLRLLVYGFNGQFHRAFRTEPDKNYSALTDSATIMYFPYMTERFSEKCLTIGFINNEGQTKKTIKSRLYPLARPAGRFVYGSETNYFWEYDGQTYFLEYGADTIYRISGIELTPQYTLTGKYKIKELQDYFENVSSANLLIAPALMHPKSVIFESENVLIFRVYNSYNVYYQVYNKKTKTFHRTHYADAKTNGRNEVKIMNFFVDDMVSGLNFTPLFQSKGTAIGFVSASDIIEKREDILHYIELHPSLEGTNLKSIIENLIEDDNSLLMMVTLK